MALPKIDNPTYTLELPSTGEIVKYRPFLVKEEKLLVLANETKDQDEMIRATQQVVTNCSFGKVQGDELPIFDMQKIFLELRKVSVSDTVDIRLLCGHCEAPIDIQIELDTFKLHETEGHAMDFQIAEDISVKMKYPNAKELTALGQSETEGDIYKVAETCIETVFYGDAIIEFKELREEERSDFIDNLTSEQFSHIKNFFETMPVIENHVEYKCNKCKKDNVAYLNGYYDFFV